MAVVSGVKERLGVTDEERQHPEFLTSQEAAPLIVLSTSGRTGLGLMLMGSVAEAESTSRGPASDCRPSGL